MELRSWSTDAGGGEPSSLGSAVGIGCVALIVGVALCCNSGCTLGSVCGACVISWNGMGCTLFNCVANVRRAFLTGSPAARLGVVVEGGEVSIVIMSAADWRRKSSILIAGKGICFGKKVTVSQSRGVLVRGK